MTKKIKRALVAWALGASLASPAAADEGWFSKPDATDLGLQGAFTALTLVDWGQTTYFLDLSKRMGPWGHEHIYEVNPFLGKHPSQAKLNSYIGGVLVVHPLVAWALPKPWRNYFQMASVMVEVVAVAHNTSVYHGVQLKFPF